jgi:acetylornithine deacetylase
MDTTEILKAIVGFPTITSGPNLELMHWLQQHLAGLGADVRVMPGTDANRINRWARLGPMRMSCPLLARPGHPIPFA